MIEFLRGSLSIIDNESLFFAENTKIPIQIG